MSSLIHLLTLLALTRGETCHEVLDMMEDLEARYDDKMLTLEARYNERLALEKEEIRTLVASEVSRTRELGQVMMCVYRYHWTSVASTITYDRYIDPNYNNGGRADMNLNMRFLLSKCCRLTPKLHRYIFYFMYHKYYQA